jgi:hypothetical protein
VNPEEERIKQIMKERGVDRLTAEQMHQVATTGGDLLEEDEQGNERPAKATPIDKVKYE